MGFVFLLVFIICMYFLIIAITQIVLLVHDWLTSRPKYYAKVRQEVLQTYLVFNDYSSKSHKEINECVKANYRYKLYFHTDCVGCDLVRKYSITTCRKCTYYRLAQQLNKALL